MHFSILSSVCYLAAQIIDASRLAAELERLGEASDVAAVVLRVTSPGGSALGSDTIHRCEPNMPKFLMCRM